MNPDPGFGWIALCAHGKLGLVTNQRGAVWMGVNLDTGGHWQSRVPDWIGPAEHLFNVYRYEHRLGA